MTLLTVVFAAIICTVIWYKSQSASDLKIGVLCWLYWGASIMWLVDAIFEFAESGSEYFSPAPIDMLNELYLGLSAVAFGLIIWIVILLIKDPKGRLHSALAKSKR